MKDDSILVIGAGFAGLAAGIYGQMNGYRARVFEMHTQPGGLCTAWQRQGYTIDGCIHWLVGSSPRSGMHRLWEEVGIAQGRRFIDLDEYLRHETADGRTVVLYTDLERLERHLRELSPQDTEPIGELIRGIRLFLGFDLPVDSEPLSRRVRKMLRLGWLIAAQGKALRRWLNTPITDFARRFQDSALREALLEAWVPEFSTFFLLFTFAWLHERNAGYPIGGSLPMSQAMARRYTDLGGAIEYGQRVERILVEGDRAVGVRLADGSEHRADRVISAADGHATLFDLLDGRYVDDEARRPYQEWPIFPPLLYVGLGVSRSFADEPRTLSGFTYALRQPTRIGDAVRQRLAVHLYNQDPTLAPAGKTSMVVMLPSEYPYWQALATDRAAYERAKEEVGRTVVAVLEQRFPGIAGQVEMVDVATPLTFERYTGNWQGSFEGWLLTPQNAHTVMKPMRQTLPGLQGFYRCGQWVEPGGGLPTAVMSGRRLVRAICREDGRRFRTRVS
ncbi:MAG: NAD(P)/FAD-dependent oxidoreductase [Candidatus Latescibacterota bacterium]|jgi:phytoene dehydrogenase-like protein